MQNQFHPHPSDSQEQPLPQPKLAQVLIAIIDFMEHRPQASVQSSLVSPEERYSNKVSLYPYLPIEEEQRDWLERLYVS